MCWAQAGNSEGSVEARTWVQGCAVVRGEPARPRGCECQAEVFRWDPGGCRESGKASEHLGRCQVFSHWHDQTRRMFFYALDIERDPKILVCTSKTVMIVLRCTSHNHPIISSE